MFNISRRFTLPYRPEANGLVERVNQETMKHLKAITYEGGVKRNWSQYLPLVQRIINNSFTTLRDYMFNPNYNKNV